MWDDEVNSIRTFDVESQRSVEQLEQVTIYPASEVVLSRQQLQSGIAKLEKEAASCEKAFRGQHKSCLLYTSSRRGCRYLQPGRISHREASTGCL